MADNILDKILLGRRSFIQGAAGVTLATLLGQVKVSFADAPFDQRFVFIILRGAMDGLAAAPPYGDRNYISSRNGLAIPASGYTPLDNAFAVHKNFTSFADMYKAKEAILVHAVATPYRDRSHFDAQNVLESGGITPNGLNDGWLNRTISLFGGRRDSMGLAVGQTIPLMLQGSVPVGTWAPSGQGVPEGTLLISLQKLYARDQIFQSALNEAIGVHGIADQSLGMNGGGNAGKKGDNLRNREAMAATASAVGKILADPKGPRIATIELGGWDTHAQQGGENGVLANNFSALDEAFNSLKTSLGPLWSKTVVMAATEFGRTVAQNGTNGSDHGTASCCFLAGGALNGGEVYSTWPGLDKTQLYQGRDLSPTADLRQVAKGVLEGHLGLTEAEIDRSVFPESTNLRPVEGMIRKT